MTYILKRFKTSKGAVIFVYRNKLVNDEIRNIRTYVLCLDFYQLASPFLEKGTDLQARTTFEKRNGDLLKKGDSEKLLVQSDGYPEQMTKEIAVPRMDQAFVQKQLHL